MMKTLTTNESLLYTGRGSLDEKSNVGPNRRFQTIDEYITFYSEVGGLSDGDLITDYNYNITWQLYNDGFEWKYRIYDGVFYVRAVDTDSKEPDSVNDRIDGITLDSGDIVLLASARGPLCGIYIWDGSEYSRHPIFNEAVDSLSGITIVATDGTNYKNSQWKFVTSGTIVPNENLSVTIQDFVNNANEFYTYTHLHFEMLGGQYAPSSTYPLNSAKYDFDMMVDSSSDDVECIKFPTTYFTHKEYTWIKKVDDNLVVVQPTGLVTAGVGVKKVVLLEKGDFVKVKAIENPIVDGDSFISYTNRDNKYNFNTASADGKIFVIPDGYAVYSVSAVVTTPQTGFTYNEFLLEMGTTSGGNELGFFTCTNDGEENEKLTNASSTPLIDLDINDIYISIWTDGGAYIGWSDAVIDFTIHLVKL